MTGKKWGRIEPSTARWKRRYDTLRQEGFVHEEAARLATSIIGSKRMREGRRARKKWFKEALIRHPSMTKKDLEDAIDDLYDTYDWRDPWSQFYPEGGNA